MDETSPYHQQQSPYANQNQMKPQQQQQLLPRGMPPRPQQIMPRFPQQDTTNFVRTPSSAGTPGQPTRFIFASPPNQPQQQPTHYVQYTQQVQGQHTVVVQQGTNESFQRIVDYQILNLFILYKFFFSRKAQLISIFNNNTIKYHPNSVLIIIQ
jgi:hypothetical protein